MAEEVRQALEKVNESSYGKGERTTFLSQIGVVHRRPGPRRRMWLRGLDCPVHRRVLFRKTISTFQCKRLSEEALKIRKLLPNLNSAQWNQ